MIFTETQGHKVTYIQTYTYSAHPYTLTYTKWQIAALYLINRHSRRGRAAHKDKAVEEGKCKRSAERRQRSMKQRATQMNR